MPEYDTEHLISFETLVEEKERETQATQAMMLLQGEIAPDAAEAISDGQATSQAELAKTAESKNVVQAGGKEGEMQMTEESEEAQMVRKATQKRMKIREMVKESMLSSGQEALEHGATFDIEKTYNTLQIQSFWSEEYDKQEDVIQSIVVGTTVFENSIREGYEKTGKKKVYRGNPELWTPLDKVIPEEEHIKIAEAMRDYAEPRKYEEKYQTRKRREAALAPEEPQKDYIEFPMEHNFVDGGRKLEF